MNLKKKKVIVTGGSGFIGTEVVLQLLNKNYKVKIIDLKKPQVTHKNLSFKKYDLRTASHLTPLFKGWGYVLHLAAEVGGVTYNNENPATILRHNVLIDTHTIEAACSARVYRFVYISSSLVYEKTPVLPYIEEDILLLPELTYGIGKLFGERLCVAYRNQHKFNFTICRLFNAYGFNGAGGGDPNGHVIPELVKKIYSGVYRMKYNAFFITHLKVSLLLVILFLWVSISIARTFYLGYQQVYDFNLLFVDSTTQRSAFFGQPYNFLMFLDNYLPKRTRLLLITDNPDFRYLAKYFLYPHIVTISYKTLSCEELYKFSYIAYYHFKTNKFNKKCDFQNMRKYNSTSDIESVLFINE